jgi:type III pantothenate kinase
MNTNIYNLCIDKGNSSVKIGVFCSDADIHFQTIKELNDITINELTSKYKFDAVILCNVGEPNAELESALKKISGNYIYFDQNTLIPITNGYKNPTTLGKDRLAAVIGANTIKPNSNLLVIDAGTAITYDFIDANGYYHGGNIAPGFLMRLKALHHFTSRLPLVATNETNELLGNTTESAILNGAMNGIIFEINGYFEALKIKYPELSIFLTGGNANYFVSKLKSPIFAEKNLVLTGLNRILQYNVSK